MKLLNVKVKNVTTDGRYIFSEAPHAKGKTNSLNLPLSILSFSNYLSTGKTGVIYYVNDKFFANNSNHRPCIAVPPSFLSSPETVYEFCVDDLSPAFAGRVYYGLNSIDCDSLIVAIKSCNELNELPKAWASYVNQPKTIQLKKERWFSLIIKSELCHFFLPHISDVHEASNLIKCLDKLNIKQLLNITRSPYSLFYKFDLISFSVIFNACMQSIYNTGEDLFKGRILQCLAELERTTSSTAFPKDVVIDKLQEGDGQYGLIPDLPTTLKNSDLTEEFDNEITYICQKKYRKQELFIYESCHAIADSNTKYDYQMSEKLDLDLYLKAKEVELDPSQRNALNMMLEHNFFLLVGYPGTGKTYLLSLFLDYCTSILKVDASDICLVAPTGKVCQKIRELTKLDCKTPHRLLGLHDIESINQPIYNEDNKLTQTLFIFEESSMHNVTVFYHLFAALPANARVIVVGDDGQLPPIGPGKPFYDLIHCGKFQSVTLQTPRRTSNSSAIAINAVEVRQNPDNFELIENDCFRHYALSGQVPMRQLLRKLIQYLVGNLGDEFLDRVTVLTPFHHGKLGTISINKMIQELTTNYQNKSEKFCSQQYDFYVGDKVINTKNDYKSTLFNGDVGIVVRVNSDVSDRKWVMEVEFAEGIKPITFSTLKDIQLAYCLTPHKMQGSEIDISVVVLPPDCQHNLIMSREWLITAMTRAKNKCIVLSSDTESLHSIARHSAIDSRISVLQISNLI